MSNHVVYFVEAKNNLMKIGMSSNFPKRLRDLNAMSPILIRLFHAISCDTKHEARFLETRLHKEFKDKVHHGEWFRLNQQDRRKILSYEDLKEAEFSYQDMKGTYIACPRCFRYVKGKRGLMTHERFCKENSNELP